MTAPASNPAEPMTAERVTEDEIDLSPAAIRYQAGLCQLGAVSTDHPDYDRGAFLFQLAALVEQLTQERDEARVWLKSQREAGERMRDALDRAVDMREALRKALDEIEEHNGDYHHVTPKQKLDEWRAAFGSSAKEACK